LEIKGYLQQIGTFDIPKIFVIYWHICNFGKMQIISMYRYLDDIWFSGKVSAILDCRVQHNM